MSNNKKSKRKRAKKWVEGLFQSTSSRVSGVQQQASVSTNPSPSPSQPKVRQPESQPMRSVTHIEYSAGGLGIDSLGKTDDEISSPPTSQLNATEIARSATPASPSNIKEGFGIACRFVQTLLKKLPDCVDGNPVKMALSIVKTIIDIKEQIGDNMDSLTDGLRSTQGLLEDAVGKVDVQDSDEVKKEIEEYTKKIEDQNNLLLQISKELESVLRNVDYENYKKRINNVCKDIDNITNMFKLRIEIEMRKTISLMHDQMKEEQKARQEEQKARLTKSLQDLNPSKKADHRTVLEGQGLKREVCTEGTRVKILEEITNWANNSATDSPDVFWLTGQAGSGKTTIAYTIAKRFEKGELTKLGANFLCSRQFDETRSLHRIFPTIAYQLAHKCGPYEEALHAQVADKASIVDHDVAEQVQELLVGPWEKASRALDIRPYLVVIDALDEIIGEGGSRFLAVLLTTINQQPFVGLKFLVTSRTDPDIVHLCETFQSKFVCRLQDVPIEDAGGDVARYLDAKLPNIIGSPELLELRNRASGLFIYAATAVRLLTAARSLTRKEQMRKLDKLLNKPSGLSSVGKDKSPIDALYEQILYDAFADFTDEEDLGPRLRILFTFLCAAERISTSIAATLMDEDDELAKSVLNDLHAVLYIQDGRVFWYHASFPDFLFDESRSNFSIGSEKFNFWRDENAQHNLVALSCLRVMNSEDLGLRFNIAEIPSSFLLDSEHPEELSKNISKNITPVLQYSSLYWARHLSSTTVIQEFDNICHFISHFLQIRVLFWIEAMNLLGWNNQCTPILDLARQWVSKFKRTTLTESLARDLLEAANFATYFAGSPAAESTPHLYISSLATWKQASTLSLNWKHQFSRIPIFNHANTGNDVPLLVIRIPDTYVLAVALSKNGAWIVSGSSDSYVRIWDASTGKEVKILKGHTNSVISVVISSDDKMIASGSEDCTVRLWEVSTGQCLRVMKGHTDRISSVSFSANGLRLVSGSSDKSIRIWDSLTGNVVTIINGHTDWVTSVAISSDGAWIASGSGDHSLRLWDTLTGEELKVMNGHTGKVYSVAISQDNAWVVSGSADHSVRLWDAATGKELRVMEGHTYNVHSVAFSSNGDWIIAGSADDSTRVWSTSTGAVLKVLEGHTISQVWSIMLSNDATRVISGSRDGTVRVWNVSPSTSHNVSKGTRVTVASVAFSRDDTQVLFGCDDGSVHVWDATTRRELNVLRECMEGVESVAFSNDGIHIAWASEKKVWVWDLLRNIKVQVLEGHTNDVQSIAFSSDGSLVASGSSDYTVRLWDALKGVELKRMNGHTRWVRSVTFSGDGKKIVSGSDDRSIRIWDVVSGETLKMTERSGYDVLSVAFSSDSTRIVSGSLDGTVTVWDAQTGAELMVLRGHTDWVYSVAFSRDDVHIVSSSSDCTVRIWHASTGEEMKILQGRHTQDVSSIAISSDGKSIISGSWDGSVILWDIEDPGWYKGKDNWILSYPSENRLLWAPPETQVLLRSNCHVLVGEHLYSSINFENSVTGPDWSQCYTPTHPAN